MVAIHALVEQKFAFLSFYYLPMILAGFYGGRRFAVMAGVFVVALVFYYQYFQGLDMLPGFYPDALLALGPWAGFLILTGYVVGGPAGSAARGSQERVHGDAGALDLSHRTRRTQAAGALEPGGRCRGGDRAGAGAPRVRRREPAGGGAVARSGDARPAPAATVVPFGVRFFRGRGARHARRRRDHRGVRALLRDRRRRLGHRGPAAAVDREDPRGGGRVRDPADGDTGTACISQVDRPRGSREGGGQDVREGCGAGPAQRRGPTGGRGAGGGPEGRLGAGRELGRPAPARHAPGHTHPEGRGRPDRHRKEHPEGKRHHTGGEPRGEPRNEWGGGLPHRIDEP